MSISMCNGAEECAFSLKLEAFTGGWVALLTIIREPVEENDLLL